jgi:hypothetical protein
VDKIDSIILAYKARLAEDNARKQDLRVAAERVVNELRIVLDGMIAPINAKLKAASVNVQLAVGKHHFGTSPDMSGSYCEVVAGNGDPSWAAFKAIGLLTFKLLPNAKVTYTSPLPNFEAGEIVAQNLLFAASLDDILTKFLWAALSKDI